ncbi:hypothetical protein BK809_0000917 [Diplodia seriata]|uniref:Uncharacterized protein n=1 Tax=Diplodia seriata TaxID=420778 RepID=A0A1S8B5S1_9PEZI|nr:hypothetical protein BK809_0000917 [Diplodia seriata]
MYQFRSKANHEKGYLLLEPRPVKIKLRAHARMRPSNNRKPPTPTPYLPTSTAGTSRTTHLLELSLLHRWTTRTAATACCIPADLPVMQIQLPRRALQYGWLLDSIFAFTLLDEGRVCAADGTTDRCNRAALTYYNRALRGFRREMARGGGGGGVTRENCDAVYLVSVAVAVVHMAGMGVARAVGEEYGGGGGGGVGGRRERLPSVLEAMPAFFELLRGTGAIAMACIGWLVESVASVAAVLALPPARLGDGDGEARSALERLARVNDALHGGETAEGGLWGEGASALETAVKAAERAAAERVDGEGKEEDQEVELMAEAHRMYGEQVIPPLVRAYAEDARGEVDAFWLNFPIFAGRRFKEGIERCDPMALLVLMHWAVLVERHGKKAWWARDVGRRLIEEISVVLDGSEFRLLPDFRDAMAWARLQVGLPDVLSDGLSSGFEVMEVSDDVE